ncbi:MAG: glycosyltransferase family 4 protein [Bacteroidales bacterium]|nr:glycosyltransferase family 4 protein [Bacteroidales bacterium]
MTNTLITPKLRIAAFGFRSIPLRKGCAGADKFAMELYPRLVKIGHQVVGYNRLYPGQEKLADEYEGVRIINFKTINQKGFDTLIHSLKCTLHIIFWNTANVVHIQNGGNSIWALLLRIAGKKVFISQDGIDWNRDKWPWYAKFYLRFSAFITAYIPNQVIFDNIFAQDIFEKKFKKKFAFIPFGSEVPEFEVNDDVFANMGLVKGEYFLFIGRFIPDKGLHYLIPAFNKLKTTKKLVLVGGSPNPSDYEKTLISTADNRIIFSGYIYGEVSLQLMKHAYCYIQPSDIEGLSPVILNVMGIGTPIICSDIKENVYAVADTATLFKQGNIDSLYSALELALNSKDLLLTKANLAKKRALALFNWDKVALEHERMFKSFMK